MNSLFNAEDNLQVVNRINQINPTSAAQWGKMDAAQMLAHCQVPLKIFFNEITVKKNWIGILFGRIAKKQLLSDQPFKKNLPTIKEAIINDERDIEKEKQELIGYIKRMATANHEGFTLTPHPFFGKMTIQEWDAFQHKHIDHHLKQFGV